MGQGKPVPPDPSRQDHVDMVKCVLFSQPEQPFCILGLRSGLSVAISADAEQFKIGGMYKFFGVWQWSAKGYTFRAQTYAIAPPITREGLIGYLLDTCTGMTRAKAENLFKAFEFETIKTLRDNPSAVISAGLAGADLCRDWAESLTSCQSEQNAKMELFTLFKGRGFPGKSIDASINRWGAKSAVIVRRNPYALMVARIPGCGWKRCDKLFLDLGGQPARLKRQGLALSQALTSDRSGSTWIPLGNAEIAAKEAIGQGAEPRRAMAFARRAGLLIQEKIDGREWVSTEANARAERDIATAVVRLLSRPSGWPALESTGESGPSEHQIKQLQSAVGRGSIGILSGGPGTGKTFTLSHLLKRVVSLHGASSVVVAAPTGKAATRATEALKSAGIAVQASTIHRLLSVASGGGGSYEFSRKESNPIDAKFVVIDECSMIDTSLMASLMRAVGSGTSVLLVGDPYQLPPVGHGAPMRDMIAAGLPHGELTETRRNSGLIVAGCHAIKHGREVETCDRIDTSAEVPQNLRLISCDAEETVGSLMRLLKSVKKWCPVWESQVIVGTNETGLASRKSLNDAMAKALNPVENRKPGEMCIGDKVICTKNSRSILMESPWGSNPLESTDAGQWRAVRSCEESETFVANGEQGRVIATGHNGAIIEVGKRFVLSPKPKFSGKSDDSDNENLNVWELGYAITCHKSQGSEWPLVIVIADKSAGGVAEQHWWYTALSRGKQATIIFGDAEAFETQRRRQSLTLRKTQLAHRIAETQKLATEATKNAA